jgi:deoxycytidylate deaminase
MPSQEWLQKQFSESELILGLIGAVGTEMTKVREILKNRLELHGYTVVIIGISKDIIPMMVNSLKSEYANEYLRLSSLMDAGNEARKSSNDNSILALGAAALINSKRRKEGDLSIPQHEPKRAYIISSLKHPDEVTRLRQIYPQGFYLLGIHADHKRRINYLNQDKGIVESQANQLIERDQNERDSFGQRVTRTFHLSDFFVHIDGEDDYLKNGLWRVLDLLFANPFVTPTFDEYAMFLAFSASLRSADLSRQVGAVVAMNEQVIATGANDCPKAGGGLYWPMYNQQTHRIEDQNDGRDYMRGEDSNKIEQNKIITDILVRAAQLGIDREKLERALGESRIGDLTEFGRVVHAEMDAILSCGRASICTKGSTLYTTTFPCHNCAKHIIAAGIARIVFIEPYPKSKAAEFHNDSIQVGFTDSRSKKTDRPIVRFEPFVGVGPRRFFDLFSVGLGSGYPLERKDASGKVQTWKVESGRLRLQMLPVSYLDLELVAADMFHKACPRRKETP